MKKLIGCLIVMTSLSVAFVIGCADNKAPTVPPKTPTPVPTATRTKTPVPVFTPTVTVTGTLTPTVTPTPQANLAMVNLGTALNYVVLAYSGVTNSGASTLCGSLGLYPLTSVDGGIVMTCGGVQDIANGAANIAKQDLGTAYTDAAGRTGGAVIAAGSDIGGLTFYPGLYNDGGDLTIGSADVILDAQGNANAVFIFQVNGILNVTSGRQVTIINSGKASRVFWQVTDYCSLGTTVSMIGNIMAYNSVTLNTLAVLNGRAMGSNGNVTLLANTITKPAP